MIIKMTKTLQPLSDRPIRNHKHSSAERLESVTDKRDVTVHGCYKHLIVPVDLYQLIKQSFKKL